MKRKNLSNSFYQEELRGLSQLENCLITATESNLKSILSLILNSKMIFDNSKIYGLFKLFLIIVQIRPNITELVAEIILQLYEKNIFIDDFLKTILENPTFKYFVYQLYKREIVSIEHIIDNLNNNPDLFLYFAPEIIENNPTFYNDNIRLTNKCNYNYDPNTHCERRELGINDSEVALAIRNDDIDKLKEIISKNAININEFLIEPSFFEKAVFVNRPLRMIDYSAYFCSNKCFDFFIEYGMNVTQSTIQYAIAGGNESIINKYKDNNPSLLNSSILNTSIQFHRYNICKHLIDFGLIHENVDTFTTCIYSHNTTSLLNFLKIIDVNAKNSNIYFYLMEFILFIFNTFTLRYSSTKPFICSNYLFFTKNRYKYKR